MPELAEVFAYAQSWSPGLHKVIRAVELHAQSRVFRGTDCQNLQRTLVGRKLLNIETHGKQMFFLFSTHARLGIHLGMTGKLSVETPDYPARKSDHLILRQVKQSLVFSDHRMFGRVLFDASKIAPGWWSNRPPGLLTAAFTCELVQAALQRRRRLSLKAILLRQEIFPGIGNWMADEILWRARLAPDLASGELNASQSRQLWREIRWVAAQALKIVGPSLADPPATWLFSHRWKDGGNCPRCHSPLRRQQIGGRTTCWCPACQDPSRR